MQVCFLSTRDSHCGIASYTASLRESLQLAGVQAEIEPIDRTQLGYLSRQELPAHFRALAHRMSAADVVHLQHEFGIFGGAYGYAVSTATLRAVVLELARLRKPIVVTLHSDPIASGNRNQRVAALAYAAYLRMLWRTRVVTLFRTTGLQAVVHTRVTRRAAIDSGVPPDRIEMIRLGLPAPNRPTTGDEQRAAIRQRLGYSPEQKVLAIFGFLESYKGYRTAIRALSHLPDDYHLAIVGGAHPFSEGPASEAILAELEREPSVKERVTVSGFVPAGELADYQAAADIFLAPYRRGTPLSSSASITWALASGRPLVASALPAFVELNDYAHCLELVTPDAPRELAQTIERLQADEERAAQLVFNADRYCRLHSWDATARAHIQLYERVIQRRPPVAGRLVGSVLRRAHEPATASATTGMGKRRPSATVQEDGMLALPVQVDGRPVTFCVDPRPEDPVVQGLIDGGYPEEPQMSLMLRLIRPGDVVVDIGAHVGTYALAAAARECRVIAMDADPRHVEELQRAVTLNGFNRVTVIHGAASDHDGQVRFFPNGPWGVAGWNGVEPDNGASPVEVPARRVSSVLADLGLERVDFIKLDIEGSEPYAIDGMLPVLEGDDAPMLLFETNAVALSEVSGTTYRALHERLERLGYRLYMVDLERVGRLVPVSSGDLMPHAVLDYLAAKRLPDDLFPWRVAKPFTHEELARRVVNASELDYLGYRVYAASVIASGPDWLVRDPGIQDALRRLREEESPAIHAALDTGG